MYYYTDDSHVYSFGVNFPNSATFGGRVVINDGSADQIFESDSGPPNVTFTGPSAGSTQITVTIDDGIPYGFGRARTGAPQHNLVYPASLNPVQIFPIEKIPIGDISLNLQAGGDGFIANKAIGIPPNQSFETINKQYIYNKYNYEYSGLNAGIPAFNVSDNADRDYFASRSSITSVSTGVSTQMERKASMFPFHPDFAGITLKEDMFPEAEEGTASFTIQDGTLLSSPRSSATGPPPPPSSSWPDWSEMLSGLSSGALHAPPRSRTRSYVAIAACPPSSGSSGDLAAPGTAAWRCRRLPA